MKVLLITPKFPNEINMDFNIEYNPFGGWIDGFIKNIKSFKEIKLSNIVFIKSKESNLINKHINNIDVFLLKYKDKEFIKKFFNEHDFDIIHIIGIEHKYIKDLLPFLPYEKTLLNITGIQYEYAKVFLSDYNKFNKSRNPLLALNLKLQRLIANKQGKIEKEILKKAKYVVGRTLWDKKSVLSINNNLIYFTCNEILRENFYNSEKWKSENFKPFTIFVSQGNYPIKGAHMVMEIIKILKQHFPNVKCKIAGENILKSKSILTFLNSSYASLIKKLIKSYKLKDNIEYTGFMNAKQIEEEMRNSHVFLMPSSIENSVNSLQEAMILGVPCVTSLVGGVSSLIEKDSVLTYKFNDPEDGARKIAMIFNNKHLASYLGNNANKTITKIANPEINSLQMINIYQKIIGENK